MWPGIGALPTEYMDEVAPAFVPQDQMQAHLERKGHKVCSEELSVRKRKLAQVSDWDASPCTRPIK